MKKIIAILMAAALVFVLVGCGPESSSSSVVVDSSSKTDETPVVGNLIGVSMPSQSLQRWNQDGANVKAQLEAAGYTVDLQYAGDSEIPKQVSQIENMISGGCKVLVIAAIDGSSLTEVLKEAKAQNIPVIAYDRLIMNSDAVTYYATFDNYKVGVMQAEFIIEKLDLKNAKGPFNFEFFTGDPGDNNARFFFDGAMDNLKPFIDSGVIKVLSGQTTFEQVATKDWKTENAQTRMENLISSNGYSATGKKLDAVVCSNDSTAKGAVNGLVSAGYTKDTMPWITGQDCDKPNVIDMKAGLQSMSVFKDTRTLAEKTVGMVDSIVKGGTPEINDTATYDNGTGVIPSYLCDPIVVTLDNYKAQLIDSGYYTEADIT